MRLFNGLNVDALCTCRQAASMFDEIERLREAVRKIRGAGTQQGNYTYTVAKSALDRLPGQNDDRTAVSHTADSIVNRELLTALKVAKANLQPLGDSPALDIIISAIDRAEQRS